MNFELIRAATVEVKQVIDERKHSVAEITVNGKYQHRFSPKSRISQHLDIMTPVELSSRLTGGSFFFIGDNMVDMRDGEYNGFIHTNETISKFMDVLGYQFKDTTQPRHRRTNDATDSKILLRKAWSQNPITVPGYKQGGEFTSELSFLWNPFNKTVNSSFDLVRLICENGMVGLTSFLNTKIPLVNRWEEHLDISSRQIQNKVDGIVTARIQRMGQMRASVNDCMLMEQHAQSRLGVTVGKADGENNRLHVILNVVSPKMYLSSVYKANVFDDSNLASQLPSHLTLFDVFNIATELRTHTGEVPKSSNFALDKFSNGILFDRDSDKTAGAGHSSAKVGVFSDPEKAFWGVMN